MSKDIHFFHGAVLSRLVESQLCTIEKSTINSAYIVNQEIGIYIKYSAKRSSPWKFSFSEQHLDEMEQLSKLVSAVYIILVCYYDGIVSLRKDEFHVIVNEGEGFPKWVKAVRNKNEKYGISGTDGKLRYKIADSNFPEQIFNTPQ